MKKQSANIDIMVTDYLAKDGSGGILISRSHLSKETKNKLKKICVAYTEGIAAISISSSPSYSER